MRQTGIIAGILIFGTAAFGASPQLLNLVMPDAQIVAGANVSTAKLSPLGEFLLSKLQSSAGLAKLTAISGFNPLTDVSEILMAASNPAHAGFVAMLGNFNAGQIQTALANNPQVTSGTYDGATVFTFTPKTGTPSALAFIGTSIALAGDSAGVNAALDRSSGTNTLPAALAPQINALGANDDAWLVSDAPIGSLIPAAAAANGNGAMAAQFLKSIQSFDASVKFGENIQTQIGLVADNEQDAAALGNVVKMVIGFGASGAAGRNTGNPANPQLASLLALLANATVTTDGTNVAIALSVPESQIEGIVNNHPAGN